MTFDEAFKIFAAAIKTAAETKVNGTPWFDQVCQSHFGDSARGSKFTFPKDEIDSYLLDMRNEFTFSMSNGVLTARITARETVGVVGAIDINKCPNGAKVKVESLGHHPSLVMVDDLGVKVSPPSTKVATFVVEVSGDEYEADCKDLNWPKDQPILATFFPGDALPPSKPHDCEEGQELLIREAAELGWKVVKLNVN